MNIAARMQEGTEQIAALRGDDTEEHMAEHIRGMVAVSQPSFQ